jgi:hypothetical protein
MILKTVPLLLLAFFLVACAIRESRIPKSGIAYTQEKFKQTSPVCADSSACASYEVSYPEFTGLDTAVNHRLRDLINGAVSMGNPEAEDWDMKKIASDFIQSFETFKAESPELAADDWYYKADISVETVLDTLISMIVHDEYFTGGAHGGAGTYFINIDPKTGNNVVLDDVLRPGYKQYLKKIAEQLFRQAREIPDSVSFNEVGFEFPDNEFQLNDNFGLTREGIMFVYNSYEIAPFSAGPTTVLIPYEKLKDWLK